MAEGEGEEKDHASWREVGAGVLRIIYEGCLVRSCDFAAILPCTD